MTSVLEPQTRMSKLDKIRERELFRFYQPPDPAIGNPTNGRQSLSAPAPTTDDANGGATDGLGTVASPDATLTALAQLCALRLNASRAMVSVIGKKTQYFIAESTKTLNLVDTQKSEVEGDELWIGCGQVGKDGRLCEKTIELRPFPGRFPCFTVTDLSKDSRFNQLPFVSGPPFFKFYAGTPLTTKKGINIGSLFILDDIARPPLTADQEEFLGSVGQIVMKHMEINREAQERQKALKMSRGLNSFVEGKDRLCAEDYFPDSGIASNKLRTPDADVPQNISESGVSEIPSSLDSVMQPLDSSNNVESPSDPDSSQDEPDADIPDGIKDMGYRSTFARAANLLRESLDLQTQGGVVFLDTAIGFHGRDDNVLTKSSQGDEPQNGEIIDNANSPSPVIRRPSVMSDFTLSPRSSFSHGLETRKSQRMAKIISFSSNEPLLGSQSQGPKSFSPLAEDFLQELLITYPHGKIWSFDEDGNLSSSEEELPLKDDDSPSNIRDVRIRRQRLVVNYLQICFPGVRQLLFVPLWDSGALRWFSGCFAFSTSNLKIFSVETELSFSRAFNNSVMAEVSRLASKTADRQKGDFIGSISHELRSPLHGILASAEFLSETESDAFQISLVDTISSCGRTLLDTINHVLDFSKINSFERNWHDARKPGARSKRASRKTAFSNKEAPPLMNIYAITDLAAVTEEVIEGVYVGQIYQDISSSDNLDISSMSKSTAFDHSLEDERGSSIGRLNAAKNGKKDVEIILDFTHDDFTFSAQPGALRRVVMNIFGNALKYTVKGTIKVKISLQDIENPTDKQTGMRMFEFKVEDTGKGISSDYLRTKLYTPFCQEDVLASGTGLGLSIVRSIVTLLNGSIDVRSQVGQGTEITVCIPLMRVAGAESTSSTPSTVASGSSALENPISALQAGYSEKFVSLFGFESDPISTSQRSEIGRVLCHYVSDWYGLRVVPLQSTSAPVDIIIVNENDLPKLLKNQIATTSIVVLCSNMSRWSSQRPSHLNGAYAMEFVTTPFGPYKVAKAMYLCLERASSLNSLLEPNANFSGNPSTGSDTDTVVPNLENLTLEPRDGNKAITVKTNGVITAGESLNAQMAVDNLSSNDTEQPTTSATHGQEFPFPSQESENSESQDRHGPIEFEPRRPKLIYRVTEPLAKPSPFFINPATKKGEITPNYMSPNGSGHVTPTNTILPEEKRPPRLLLVDDNSINLRLLETYMRKRKHKLVDMAENGAVAVKAVKSHPEGYDIIFMDISMPIMNGFEATRQIRELESARTRRPASSPPALIIALTGLASGQDQADAFANGIDLFMTKPVAFKEVGRLLDNWEANGGLGNLVNG